MMYGARMAIRHSATIKVAVLLLLFGYILSADSISIGFSQRSQTVSEADIIPERFDYSVIKIQVHADRAADRDYSFRVSVVESNNCSSATVHSAIMANVLISDAIFSNDVYLQMTVTLLTGDVELFTKFDLWNDYLPEEEECFTLEISPLRENGINDTFSCNEDAYDASDFFCLHTINIEDNDNDAEFEIGFEEENYNVTEGGTVNVCVGFIVSQELENATFSEVYILFHLLSSSAGLESDYQFFFNANVPLTNNRRRLCADVVAIEDGVLEEVESATHLVYIDEGSNVTVTIPATTITIFDNSDEVIVGLEKPFFQVNEVMQVVSICATIGTTNRDCPVGFPFQLIFSTSEGSAVFDEDYSTTSITRVIDSCKNRACVDLSIVDDDIFESVESFNITIERTQNLDSRIILGPVEGIVYIIDEDAPIRVGYEVSVYQIPSAEETIVELCAVISAPINGMTVRPFSLETVLPVNIPRVTFEMVESGHLVFETNDGHHCYNLSIIIPADKICEDFSTENISVNLSLIAGDGDIDVQPSTATFAITDSIELECAPIVVGYAETSYTVSEGQEVTVCVEITSHPIDGAPRPFSLTLITENGTADSGNDYMSSSVDIQFEVGDNRQCEVIFTFEDETCEFSNCSHEYFLSSLNTNDYRVNLEPSETTIFIEDVETQNCSDLLADTNCMTPLPSSSPTGSPPLQSPSPANSNTNNNQLVYVYIFVPLGLLFIVILIVLVVIIVCIRQRRKTLSVSLPKYSNVRSTLPSNLVKLTQSNIFDEIKLKIPKEFVFSKDQIHLSLVVGQGESGVVYKALLDTKSGKELVAVKTVKALFASSDVDRLIKEINIMSLFNHPNVMALRGVCLDQESPLLIMQFMSNGSVLEYVRQNKHDLMLVDEVDTLKISSARKLMLGMCNQIAKGMEYLAEEQIVHRDLAARNCMIDMNGVIKVTDFGLTEDVYASNYFRKEKSDSGSDEKVPIRWMAPESIDCDLYTTKTDVWSYGVTCWEVFTCGQIPYHGISVMSLFAALSRGERLNKPQNIVCTDEIFSAIRVCWHESPEQRPTFFNLVQQMSAFLEEEAGYVDLNSSLNWRRQEQHEGVVATQVQSKNDYELQMQLEEHFYDTAL